MHTWSTVICLVHLLGRGLSVHYCYFCSTSLSGFDGYVQQQVMNQRLFHYPREAIQSQCSEPWLSKGGRVQICSEPMCVSIRSNVANVNFTVLGCADYLLRPSVKMPEKGAEHCLSLGRGKGGVDFSLCFCSSSLCNVGDNHSKLSTFTPSHSSSKWLEGAASKSDTPQPSATFSISTADAKASTVSRKSSASFHSTTGRETTETVQTSAITETSSENEFDDDNSGEVYTDDIFPSTVAVDTIEMKRWTFSRMNSVEPSYHVTEPPSTFIINANEAVTEEQVQKRQFAADSTIPPSVQTTIQTLKTSHVTESNVHRSTFKGKSSDFYDDEKEVVEMDSEEMAQRASEEQLLEYNRDYDKSGSKEAQDTMSTKMSNPVWDATTAAAPIEKDIPSVTDPSKRFTENFPAVTTSTWETEFPTPTVFMQTSTQENPDDFSPSSSGEMSFEISTFDVGKNFEKKQSSAQPWSSTSGYSTMHGDSHVTTDMDGGREIGTDMHDDGHDVTDDKHEANQNTAGTTDYSQADSTLMVLEQGISGSTTIQTATVASTRPTEKSSANFTAIRTMPFFNAKKSNALPNDESGVKPQIVNGPSSSDKQRNENSRDLEVVVSVGTMSQRLSGVCMYFITILYSIMH